MRAQTTGSFTVYSLSTGDDITPRSRKACALLAYLVAHSGGKLPKERLAALLWGDRGDPQARASLRQVLLELRRTLNRSRQVIFSDRMHIWLSTDAVVEASVDPTAVPKEAFEDLDGITPEFDTWLAGERDRRVSAEIGSLEERAEKLLEEGRGAESLVVVDQIQLLDPGNEDALLLGMEAEFQCAHPGGIAERYRATAEHLKGDLGVEPSAASRELRDRLIRRLTKRQPAIPLHESDKEYFRRRAAEERSAVGKSKDERSRQVHETLADRYGEIAAAIELP